MESTYIGFGLRVDRVGFPPTFEFLIDVTASSASVEGATGLFTCPLSCGFGPEDASVDPDVEEDRLAGFVGGLPRLGLEASSTPG